MSGVLSVDIYNSATLLGLFTLCITPLVAFAHFRQTLAVSFRRLHLSATYVIKKVSFQKSTDYKINCYSSRCINYCTFFLTLWFNGYFSEKKAASMTHAANKCDLKRHSVLVCARDVQSCSWIRIEALTLQDSGPPGAELGALGLCISCGDFSVIFQFLQVISTTGGDFMRESLGAFEIWKMLSPVKDTSLKNPSH